MSNVAKEEVQIKDFESFLQKCLNDKELELVNLESTKLLPLGENYGSIMLKLKATIRKSKGSPEEILHLVAKTMNPCDNPIVRWSEILKKETFMYTDIVPAYQRLERELGIDPVLDVLPKYIGHRCSLDENVADEDSILVLENLKVRGFYTCERLKGMDLAHSEAALASLARFHALGVALRQRQPERFERLLSQARPVGINFEQLDESFELSLQMFRENSCFAKWRASIEAAFSDVRAGRVYAWRSSEPWATITHADFWTNNILFHKDEEGRVDDVKFVDFQVYVLNSPARDLPFFLCGGNIDEETRDRHIDDLLDAYHGAFEERLERLGCDARPFSRQAFDKELKKQAIDVFPLCAVVAKFYVFDFSEQKGSTVLANVLQSKSSDALIRKLQDLVELYAKRGWF